MARQHPSGKAAGKQRESLYSEHLVDQQPLLAAWPRILATWRDRERHAFSEQEAIYAASDSRLTGRAVEHLNEG